jgi:hypothetical protein
MVKTRALRLRRPVALIQSIGARCAGTASSARCPRGGRPSATDPYCGAPLVLVAEPRHRGQPSRAVSENSAIDLNEKVQQQDSSFAERDTPSASQQSVSEIAALSWSEGIEVDMHFAHGARPPCGVAYSAGLGTLSLKKRTTGRNWPLSGWTRSFPTRTGDPL